MNISATFQGATVNIVNIDVDGSMCYIAFKDSSNNLKVARQWFSQDTATDNIIATNASIIS
jgi:hypothetical protein